MDKVEIERLKQERYDLALFILAYAGLDTRSYVEVTARRGDVLKWAQTIVHGKTLEEAVTEDAR